MDAIYLAITATGLQDALRIAEKTNATVWCGADATTQAEFDLYVGKPIFRVPLSLAAESNALVQGVVDAIREAHPTATVWIESRV